MSARSNSNTFKLTLSALFIALTAVCSWISIPIPGTSVPINLATFSVILAGLLLGTKAGALSMLTFLILGAVGLPVFHGFTGGMGIVFGPTSGFLFGYIALAAIAGLTFGQNTAANAALARYIPCVILGETALYLLGSIWFVLMTGNTMAVAVTACILPFLPGDLLKAILAWLIAGRLRKVLA